MRIHLAILRSAAWLVPGEQRTEWFAEWNAELWYVRRSDERQTTSFCLGAFRDAIWLRRNSSPTAQPWLRLQSPAQCLGLLGMVAAACVLFALRYHPPDFPLLPIGQSLLAMLLMPLMALPGLLATTSLRLGEYPANRYGWRWVFLASKIALLLPIVFFRRAGLVADRRRRDRDLHGGFVRNRVSLGADRSAPALSGVSPATRVPHEDRAAFPHVPQLVRDGVRVCGGAWSPTCVGDSDDVVSHAALAAPGPIVERVVFVNRKCGKEALLGAMAAKPGLQHCCEWMDSLLQPAGRAPLRGVIEARAFSARRKPVPSPVFGGGPHLAPRGSVTAENYLTIS